MAEVRIGEEAAVEYTEALAWYSTRSASAAAGFEAAVVEAVERIGESPERFPECPEEGFRFAHLTKYPYCLIYQVAGDMARVVAVAHARRRPGYWAGRVE